MLVNVLQLIIESMHRKEMRQPLVALVIFAPIVCSLSGWGHPERGMFHDGSLRIDLDVANVVSCQRLCESVGGCCSMAYDNVDFRCILYRIRAGDVERSYSNGWNALSNWIYNERHLGTCQGQ